MSNHYRYTPAEARIRAALSLMPYGSLSEVWAAARDIGLRDGSPAPIELDDIAAYLEALAGRLGPIGEAHHQLQIKHSEICGDIEAVRRIFGVKP